MRPKFHVNSHIEEERWRREKGSISCLFVETGTFGLVAQPFMAKMKGEKERKKRATNRKKTMKRRQKKSRISGSMKCVPAGLLAGSVA